MAKKRITIVLLLVLVGLCGCLSLVQVRPVSGPAKLWIAAELNLLQVRSQAAHYYQGIRLIYDFVRQLRELQDQEHAVRPAPGSGVQNCSLRLPTSFKETIPDGQICRLSVDGRSRQIHYPKTSTSPAKAALRFRPRRLSGRWVINNGSLDLPYLGLEELRHFSRSEAIAISRTDKIGLVGAKRSSLVRESHVRLALPVTCALENSVCIWSSDNLVLSAEEW